MYYTGVGSRKTPKEIQKMMREASFMLAKRGWCLRSGGADGADLAFQHGVAAYVIAEEIENPHEVADIYIPWEGFNHHYSSEAGIIVCPGKWGNWPEAEKIAARVHPAWHAVKKDGSPVMERSVKALHTRNVYQVLGDNLDQPSKFLLCWAPVDRWGVPKGGTRTAWVVAEQSGVECFNLFHESVHQRIVAWLERL